MAAMEAKNGATDETAEDDQIAFAMMVTVATNLNEIKRQTEKPTWVIDSGCSAHMTPNKQWLVGYQS